MTAGPGTALLMDARVRHSPEAERIDTRGEPPVWRAELPDGSTAWVASGYDAARQVLDGLRLRQTGRPGRRALDGLSGLHRQGGHRQHRAQHAQHRRRPAPAAARTGRVGVHARAGAGDRRPRGNARRDPARRDRGTRPRRPRPRIRPPLRRPGHHRTPRLSARFHPARPGAAALGPVPAVRSPRLPGPRALRRRPHGHERAAARPGGLPARQPRARRRQRDDRARRRRGPGRRAADLHPLPAARLRLRTGRRLPHVEPVLPLAPPRPARRPRPGGRRPRRAAALHLPAVPPPCRASPPARWSCTAPSWRRGTR
ncbi:hypothetical protein SRIMM317S_05658 [Streptomyces rimosus subsp. rimosus]